MRRVAGPSVQQAAGRVGCVDVIPKGTFRDPAVIQSGKPQAARLARVRVRHGKQVHRHGSFWGWRRRERRDRLGQGDRPSRCGSPGTDGEGKRRRIEPGGSDSAQCGFKLCRIGHASGRKQAGQRGPAKVR